MVQHLPAGHPAQPHPQDVFPFLLLRTILAIDTATMITRTTLMIIVANIEIPPVLILP